MNLTFTKAAENFIDGLEQPRRRGTLAPNTRKLYTAYARKAAGFLGGIPLAEVRNGRVKAFVETLRAENYSPATITGIVTTLQLIVNSVKSAEGERLYPLKLDLEFVNVPVVDPKQQNAPCASATDIEKAIIEGGEIAALVAFLAASGLRISEALALRVGTDGDCYDPVAGHIHIRQTLKTPSAARTVFVPESFRQWFNTRIPSTGQLFNLPKSTVYDILSRMNLPPCHSYRRFRATTLRKSHCPEEIIKAQLGHSKGGDVTNRYSRAAQDVEWVRNELEKIGIGFTL